MRERTLLTRRTCYGLRQGMSALRGHLRVLAREDFFLSVYPERCKCFCVALRRVNAQRAFDRPLAICLKRAVCSNLLGTTNAHRAASAASSHRHAAKQVAHACLCPCAQSSLRGRMNDAEVNAQINQVRVSRRPRPSERSQRQGGNQQSLPARLMHCSSGPPANTASSCSSSYPSV